MFCQEINGKNKTKVKVPIKLKISQMKLSFKNMKISRQNQPKISNYFQISMAGKSEVLIKPRESDQRSYKGKIKSQEYFSSIIQTRQSSKSQVVNPTEEDHHQDFASLHN